MTQEEDNAIYAEAVRDGQKAGFIGSVAHDWARMLNDLLPCDAEVRRKEEIRDSGFKYGLDNPASSTYEEETREEESSTDYGEYEPYTAPVQQAPPIVAPKEKKQNTPKLNNYTRNAVLYSNDIYSTIIFSRSSDEAWREAGSARLEVLLKRHPEIRHLVKKDWTEIYNLSENDKEGKGALGLAKELDNKEKEENRMKSEIDKMSREEVRDIAHTRGHPMELYAWERYGKMPQFTGILGRLFGRN